MHNNLNLFLLCFMMNIHFCLAEDVVWKGETYNTEKVSELITIITSTNPIPSIPDIDHIYQAQVSLFQIPALASCKKIIVFDGIQPGYESRANDYELYKKRIIELTENDPYFANTQLIFSPKWEHLAGSIRQAIDHVKTPFIYVHQHDFRLKRPFDLNGVIATMVANPKIKYVRLGHAPNSYRGEWSGYPDEKVVGPHFIPLSRVFRWSDQDHVTRLDYYRDFVLPSCHKNFMEASMHPALMSSIKKYGYDEGHAPFGTYLYGDLNEGSYLYHSDGSNRYKGQH
jgi:hypothetical protein